MKINNPFSKAGVSRLSANVKTILALICFFCFVHLARHSSVIPPNNIQDEDSIHGINVQSAIDTHHCINEDFHHVHKTSVWTMLNDNPSYVLSALKLGRALKKHTKDTDFDLVVMTLESKPLSDKSMKQLAEVGFINCVIKPIRPTHLEGKTRNDLQEKFGVLHVFAMTIYDTVLFLDADTFVQGPLDDLLKMDIKGKKIGVTKDIRARKWVDTFNTGVMLLHPSVSDYEYLTKKLMDETFEFEYIMSDQGFLNEVDERSLSLQ